MLRSTRCMGVALCAAAAVGCSTGSGYHLPTSTTGGHSASGTTTGGGTGSGGSSGGGTTGAAPQCSNDGQCVGMQTDAGVTLGRCSLQGICVQCLSSSDCSNQGFCDLGSNICLPSCVNDPSVCSADQVCDTQTGGCVGCLSDGDCKVSQFPHCAPSGPLQNECVQCLGPSECPYSNAGCNALSGTCGGCSDGGDCPPGLACNSGSCNCTTNAGDAGCGGDAPVCRHGVGGGTGLFCGCSASAQCDAGQACDTLRHSNGACVAGCTTQSCASNPAAPLCAPSGLCVFCLDNTGCVDAGMGGVSLPYCNSAGFCGACQDDSQCHADGGLPHCDSTVGACVQCIDYSQCPANEPGCDSLSHQCFSCHQNTDCNQGAGFRCDPGTHLCRASCANGSSCPAVQPYCNNTTSLCFQCQSGADCIADGGRDGGPGTMCNAAGFCGQLGFP